MAWTEVSGLRTQRSKTYRDSENAQKRAWSGALAALHYESELDSGVYDAEVDMTPVRVDVPAFDGWRVIANSWHYALGKDLANHGDQDGWVGFGGRQGAHWFKFRLLRVGYLHWSTRAWDDIGGAPTYNRVSLSQEISTLTIGPNDDAIDVSCLATWSNVWLTPGGGALDVSWRVNDDQLKEGVIIDQVGREWVAANRPPVTPLNETYFGFVFHIDWSDIPSIYRAGILQDVDGDWSDDDEPIELCDALDQLLALLPVSQVYVPDVELEEGEEWPRLRKRFWKDLDGNHYLLVGLRCDILNSLPAGDLVFDPTVEKQVGASGDDGEAFGTAGFTITAQKPLIGYDSKVRHIFARWTDVTIAGTIDTSYIELDGLEIGDGATTSGTPLLKVYGVDQDNPAAPTSRSEFNADPLTSAAVDWDASFGTGWNQSPSLNTIFQELVDAYTITGDAVMVQVKDDGGGSNDWNAAYHYNNSSATAPKLYIEYTAAGGALPMAMNHYHRRRV